MPDSTPYSNSTAYTASRKIFSTSYKFEEDLSQLFAFLRERLNYLKETIDYILNILDGLEKHCGNLIRENSYLKDTLVEYAQMATPYSDEGLSVEDCQQRSEE